MTVESLSEEVEKAAIEYGEAVEDATAIMLKPGVTWAECKPYFAASTAKHKALSTAILAEINRRVAEERDGLAEEADRLWRQFVVQCESIEDEPDNNKPDSPAHNFMRGLRSAAKRIRRSVDHPKYNSDYPLLQAAIRALKPEDAP